MQENRIYEMDSGMSLKERQIRVFVSSTFKDMHVERELPNKLTLKYEHNADHQTKSITVGQIYRLEYDCDQAGRLSVVSNCQCNRCIDWEGPYVHTTLVDVKKRGNGHA